MAEMSRQECEERMLGLFKQALAIYKEYNPEGNYLKMASMDGTISFNNAYFLEDWKAPIDVFMDEDGVVTSITHDLVEPEVEDESEQN